MNQLLSVFKFRNFSIFYRKNSVDHDVLAHSFENDIFYSTVPEYKSSRFATVIDVGAHIGTFSIYSLASAKGGKIYALEPNSESFELLKKNIVENNLTEHIIPLQYALSDQQGSQKLYLDSENWGHSLTNSDLKDFEEVVSIDLGTLFKVEKITECDLIKFNCEGAEFPIILSLDNRTLEKTKMMIVLFHEDLVKGYSRSDLLNFFSKHGFNVRICNEKEKRGWIIATNKKHYGVFSHWVNKMVLRLKLTKPYMKSKFLWSTLKTKSGLSKPKP